MATQEASEAIKIAIKALKLAIDNGANGQDVGELLDEIMTVFQKESRSLRNDVEQYLSDHLLKGEKA